MIFFLEMILKMAALGVRGYLSNSFNIFDCVVVLFSLVEIALSPPAFLGFPSTMSASSLSSLRTFRLFRVFKLARSWQAMQRLLMLIIKTCKVRRRHAAAARGSRSTRAGARATPAHYSRSHTCDASRLRASRTLCILRSCSRSSCTSIP